MAAVTGEESEFTHTTEEGEVQMVDASEKPDVHRKSTASGSIELSPSTVAALEEGAVERGVERCIACASQRLGMVKSHVKDQGGEHPTAEITGVSVDEKTRSTLEEEKLCRP